MATAKTIDKEVSVNDRPLRPAVMPADAPDSPVMPDVPDSPGVRQALEAEKSSDAGEGHVPPGGIPEGIPHGDRRPGAKPRQTLAPELSQGREPETVRRPR